MLIIIIIIIIITCHATMSIGAIFIDVERTEQMGIDCNYWRDLKIQELCSSQCVESILRCY